MQSERVKQVFEESRLRPRASASGEIEIVQCRYLGDGVMGDERDRSDWRATPGGPTEPQIAACRRILAGLPMEDERQASRSGGDTLLSKATGLSRGADDVACRPRCERWRGRR